MDIKEAYCSFEVSKLLKEKGFNWDCITYYVDSEPDDVKYSMLFENNTTWEKRCYSAPTHQMAMEWLREIHNINIDITPIWNQKRWEYQIFIITPTTARNPYVDDTLYMGYEEAVEAALGYILKNLI